MDYDLEFAQKIECSEEDKRQSMELVSFLLTLAKKARTYGMLALAKDAEETSSFLLSKGIQLATDGAKPEVVRSVLEFYILSGNYVGKELLERCLILEGVLAIQDGLHPKLLKELLLSFFGEDDYQMFKDELAKTGQSELEDYLEQIKESEAGSLTAFKLSNVVFKLDSTVIKEVLKEMNTTDLAKAVKDLSGKALTKIFKNMQKKGALALKETLEAMKESLSKAEISEAQQMFVNTITDLKKRERI
jgi:flagellar motor component MotA